MINKDKARQMFEEAQKISWSTKPPAVPHRAIELTEAALAEDPDFIEAAELLANDLRRAGLYPKSVEMYKYALAKVEEHPPNNYKTKRNILKELGRVLVLDKKFEEATKYLEQSLEIEITSAQEYLAAAYNKLGRHEDVIRLYAHVEQMSENGRIVDEPALHLGRAYNAIGNKKKAKEVFEAGLRFNPANDDLKQEVTSMGGGCFIATAVFDSPFAPEVKYLRSFRDDILLSYKAGRHFVDIYYEWSPQIASIVADNRWAKVLVRHLILKPLILALKFLYTKQEIDSVNKDSSE